MRSRTAPALAWGLWVTSWMLLAAGLVLFRLNHEGWAFSRLADQLVFVAFATAGAIIASRRPGNRVGWILCAIGLLSGTAAFAPEYAVYAIVTRPGSLPAAAAIAWIGSWVWYLTLGLLFTFLVLLFPDGRLPSPRWRPVAWLAGGALATWTLGFALSPGRVESLPIDNPLGIAPLGPLLSVLGTVVGPLLVVAAILGCAAAPVVRFRRSQGDERAQLKWFAFAGGINAAFFALLITLPPLEAALDTFPVPVFTFVTALVPASVAVAVLRYRLYEIDRIISRTVSYAILTGVLGAVYAGGVVLLGQLLRPLAVESDLAVAGSTLAVAALFGPARRRIQAVVDRRFNRTRYDAQRAVEAFSARLRDEVDLDQLSAELLVAVHATVQPKRASIWLRTREVES